MTRFAEARLAKRGASDVTLWVLERNAAARAFYEAIGFEPDGASKLLTIGVELVVLRYRKALSAS
jgi:RimJ/RimL family protein N-acetyltransferase